MGTARSASMVSSHDLGREHSAQVLGCPDAKGSELRLSCERGRRGPAPLRSEEERQSVRSESSVM